MLVNRKGFTLIELSIVLLIIALIVGSIVVGRQLISAAEINSQISQMNQISTAVAAFKLKYNCLPGDCSTATNFFSAAAQPDAVTNGDGDGRIMGFGGTTWNFQATANMSWTYFNGNNGTGKWAEWSYVFDHLSAAGMWDAPQYDETTSASNLPGTGYPLMRLQSRGSGPIHSPNMNSGRGGVVTGFEPGGPGVDGSTYIPAGHKIRLGAAQCNPGVWPAHVMCFQAGLNPWEAFSIDTKLDNGLPLSGTAVITTAQYMYDVDPYQYCANFAGNRYLSEATQASWGGSLIYRYCALSVNIGL